MKRGLNGWVGGWVRGRMSSQWPNFSVRGSSHPLALSVESFLLSPLSGSFAFLSGGGRPEAWERYPQPLPPARRPGVGLRGGAGRSGAGSWECGSAACLRVLRGFA